MDTESQQSAASSPEQPQVIRWRCPNCGQTLFTAPDHRPPDICAYCKDMTTWQPVLPDQNLTTGKNEQLMPD